MAGMNWWCLCGKSYPHDVTVCPVDGMPRRESNPAPALPEVGRGGTPSSTGAVLPTAATDVTCPGCGRANTAGATHCFRCNDALPQSATEPVQARLVLPGNVIACLRHNETVLLGREATDPAIKAALELHDQVSRRHAELLTGNVVRIRDLGSTNGTYVNDTPVSPETTVPIGEGLRLRFGRELEFVLLPGGLP